MNDATGAGKTYAREGNRPSAAKAWRVRGMMPRTLVVTLPLPHAYLSPNCRVHWAVKATTVSRARLSAAIAALKTGWDPFSEPMQNAEVRPVFYHKNRRRRDGSNASASLKAYEDGLEDARVIANDCGFVWYPPRFELDPENPRVEMHITELPPPV